MKNSEQASNAVIFYDPQIKTKWTMLSMQHGQILSRLFEIFLIKQKFQITENW